MPTQTFALTDAAFRFAGQFGDGQINSLNGYRQWVGRDSRIEFKATGTGVTASLVAVATQPTMRVSVDGGAFSNLTLGSAGVRTDVTLSTGLSDALHTYVLEHSAGTQANAAIEIANAISVTGAAPAISAPDGYGTKYNAADFPFAGSARGNGVARPSSASGYANLLGLQSPDSSVRFRGNPTSIKIWALNGGKYRVYQDGTALASSATVTGGGSSRYGWDTIASGLDGAEHEYEIVSASNSYVALNLYHVMLIGGTITSRPAEKYKQLVIGDSQTAGTGTTDSTLAHGNQLARAKNRLSISVGLASSRVTTFQGFGTASMGQRLGDILAFQYNDFVDQIIVLYGHNDAVNQAALADFNAEYTRLVTALVAAYPSAKILCCAILPTTASITPITRADYIAEIASVVSTLGNANVTHVTMETTDFSPTYNATAGQDTTDGIHPNSAGYTKIVNRLSSLITTAPAISTGSGGGFVIGS